MLCVTLVAVLFAWYIDRAELQNRLAVQREKFSRRESDLRYGISVSTEASELCLLAEFYSKESCENFEPVLVQELLTSLLRMSDFEAEIDSTGEAKATDIATTILRRLGCKTPDELMELARSRDPWNQERPELMPELYDLNSEEFIQYNEFLHRVFDDINSKKTQNHGMNAESPSMSNFETR